MRAFIALDLPYEIKNFITVQLFSIKKHFNYDDIKWVETQNYHLTFKFFQNIDQGIALQKFQKLKQEFVNFKNFQVSILQELGFFYNNGKIRVIFLKVEPYNLLYQIYEIISEIFGKDGFSPHLTIGRVKKGLSFKQEEILRKYRFESVNFVVNEIVLFKSLLNPMGPIYHKLDVINLK